MPPPDPDRDFVFLPAGIASMNNAGPHGLSEVLYAFGEAANNNGSAFRRAQRQRALVRRDCSASRSSSAGSRRSRPRSRSSAGSRPRRPSSPPPARCRCTAGPSASRLTGVIIVVAALTFFPALCLGPLLEHGLMQAGACSDNQPNF
jgi:K+-transporting ATPase ATPase A chain